MVEDDPAQALSHQLGESLGGLPVRQVAVPAGHPLLQAPGIGTVAQHVEIVVGLQHQDVQVPQPPPGETGAAADVGHQPQAPAAGVLHHEAHGLGGVVRDRERLDHEPRHLPRLSRTDQHRGPEPVFPQPRPFPGAGGGEHRDLVLLGKAVHSPAVVLVLVGEDHGGDALRIDVEQRHPPHDLLAGEAGVDEDAPAARLDDHGVAAAA